MPRDLYLELYDHAKIWRNLGSNAAEVLAKFQSDVIIQTINIEASRLHEILR